MVPRGPGLRYIPAGEYKGRAPTPSPFAGLRHWGAPKSWSNGGTAQLPALLIQQQPCAALGVLSDSLY